MQYGTRIKSLYSFLQKINEFDVINSITSTLKKINPEHAENISIISDIYALSFSLNMLKEAA